MAMLLYESLLQLLVDSLADSHRQLRSNVPSAEGRPGTAATSTSRALSHMQFLLASLLIPTSLDALAVERRIAGQHLADPDF